MLKIIKIIHCWKLLFDKAYFLQNKMRIGHERRRYVQGAAKKRTHKVFRCFLSNRLEF